MDLAQDLVDSRRQVGVLTIEYIGCHFCDPSLFLEILEMHLLQHNSYLFGEVGHVGLEQGQEGLVLEFGYYLRDQGIL